jgi:hypothetical protein
VGWSESQSIWAWYVQSQRWCRIAWVVMRCLDERRCVCGEWKSAEKVIVSGKNDSEIDSFLALAIVGA